MVIKKLLTWLYIRFVYLPEIEKKVHKIDPDIKVRYVDYNDPIMIQAQRERKWISDDRLH